MGRARATSRRASGFREARRRTSLYGRTLSDGREVIRLMQRAILQLAELLTVTGKLEPPPVLWRVMQTGELFFGREEASQAARAASGYVSPLDQS
jgi:hypothetical protein